MKQLLIGIVLISLVACAGQQPLTKHNKSAPDKAIAATLPLDISVVVYSSTPYIDKTVSKGVSNEDVFYYLLHREELERSRRYVARQYFSSVSDSLDTPAQLFVIFSGNTEIEREAGAITASLQGRVFNAAGEMIYEAAMQDREVIGDTVNSYMASGVVYRAQVGFYNRFLLETPNLAAQLASVNEVTLPDLFDRFAAEDTRSISTASGFNINKKGQILTNHHAVDECLKVDISIAGQSASGRVRYIDEVLDVALLDTDKQFSSHAVFSPVEHTPRLGDSVLVLGFPLQGVLTSQPSLTLGNISALAGIEDDDGTYQISAPVQQGNSGGPLIDASGSIIGVIQSKLDAMEVAGFTGDIPQNVNFAIKGRAVTDFLQKHAVDFFESNDGQHKATPDIAESAIPYTAKLTCQAYVELMQQVGG